MLKVVFIGDLIGKPGRQLVKELLPRLVEDFVPDLIIANAENSAGGNGLTIPIAQELFRLGIHVLTSGNHIWKQKEIIPYMPSEPRLIRPANYPPDTPGYGSYVWYSGQIRIGIVNLLGRVFMEAVDCPFRRGLEEIKSLRQITSTIIVDFHAEATSEKVAMGWFLDGKVSAVCGTHTHVQTADERILPGGTAYITDIGMSGPFDSVIGVNKEAIVERYLTALPIRFDVASKDNRLCGIKLVLDETTGRALSIERFQMAGHL